MSIFDSPLIQDQLVGCVFLNKTIVLDEYGGYVTRYVEGAPFDAVITENTSVEAQVAGVEYSKTFYGVKTKREVPLEYHTVFKRVKDQRTFRISVADALDTPSFSALDMKALQAEEFSITDEDKKNE